MQQAVQRSIEEDEGEFQEQNTDTLPGSEIPEPDAFVTKFQDLQTKNLVSEPFVRALVEDMKLHTMTPVQSQSINEALKGMDM